jgi:NAD(P)-dependent dehydrogenase (short-subunit alcohol dehydrogenase family)
MLPPCGRLWKLWHPPWRGN